MNFKKFFEENRERPFAVFAIVEVEPDKFAATTRAKDKGEEDRIGLPGGKVDPGEDPIEAVIRESEEEGWKITRVNPAIIHKDYIDDRLVWWFEAESATMLDDYKEKHRGITPVVVDRQTIAQSGYGNSFLG